MPAHPRSARVAQPRLTKLDRRAIEVWKRHQPLETSGAWRSTLALMEEYA